MYSLVSTVSQTIIWNRVNLFPQFFIFSLKLMRHNETTNETYWNHFEIKFKVLLDIFSLRHDSLKIRNIWRGLCFFFSWWVINVSFWESHWENLSPRGYGICSVHILSQWSRCVRQDVTNTVEEGRQIKHELNWWFPYLFSES